jgi:hypothetical protein
MRLHCVLIAAAAFALGGCASPNASLGDRFDLESADVSALHAAHPVALRNGYADVSTHVVNQYVKLDEREFTNSAIAMLSRALEKQGIRVAPDGKKFVTLRVRMDRHVLRLPHVFAPQYYATITLEATLGDGAKLEENAQDMSPGGWGRATDAASLLALKYLVKNEKFVAYLKD